MAESRINDLIQRHQALRRALGQWPTHWDDLARVMLVRRLGFVTDTVPGEMRADDLFDGTAMQEARGLANRIGGMIRPEGEQFFFLKTVEDSDERTDEAKDWLADSERRMIAALSDPRARFRQATGECDLDIVVLGTLVMFINELVGRDHLIFQSVYLKDALPFYGEHGNLEGMFRTRKMTIRQAANRYGVDKLSQGTRQKFAANSFDDVIELLIATVPREEGRADALLARNLPIAEIVIELAAKHEIAVGGFHEFPYVVARWDTTSGEDFGRSPGMIALPDANTSQAIGETMLVAGQRAADPPLLAPSDAFINAPNTYPGGIAAYEAESIRDLGANPIRLLEGSGNFPLTRDIQQDTRAQIRNAFMRNVFNLPAPGEAVMTATEVNARLEEFIRELGPAFGRLETDYTAPMVERVFHIMLRGGMLAPIPDALAGRGIRFEYESPVKRIRQQSAAVSSREWVNGRIQHAANTGRQEILDVVNFDAVSRFDAEAHSVPHNLVNGDEEIEALRQKRAEEEAEAAQAQQIQQAAAVAKDAAPALSALTPALGALTEGAA